MANPYFRNIPDFEYVNRTEEGKNLTDFTKVKNLFKKGKFREDIYQELTTFEKYQIQGDDRPDNVAFELYGDATLDWVVLMTNNILNIQTEWPMKQADFNEYLLEKYGSYDTLYTDIHHYESNEVKDSQGIVIYPKGVRVGAAQSVSYFDFYKDLQIDIVNISRPITNYQYEEKLNDDKRNIFILKPKYLNVIFDDLEELMTYKEGSTQYVSETLKRAENIRLFTWK